MAVVFNGANCLEAWRAVVDHLLVERVASNTVIVIDDPLHCGADWLARFNPQSVKPSGDSIRDVMNTVFPAKTRGNSSDRCDFYRRYERAHRRGRSKGWGTYFLRLIKFGRSNENQLERAIAALRAWRNNPHAALTLHLSSAETDRPRPRGGPCWHFGEILCPDKNSIELLAVYRNHDYFNKALGNFLALGGLLRFLGEETGRTPRRLVCHSARAYYDSTKDQLKQLRLK